MAQKLNNKINISIYKNKNKNKNTFSCNCRKQINQLFVARTQRYRMRLKTEGVTREYVHHPQE